MSQGAVEQAKTLQTKQSTEIQTLQTKLVKEATNVEREYNAKLEALKERLMGGCTMVVWKLVGK